MDVCPRCSRELVPPEQLQPAGGKMLCPNCVRATVRPPALPGVRVAKRQFGCLTSAAIVAGACVLMCALFGVIGSARSGPRGATVNSTTPAAPAGGLASTSPGMVYENLRPRGYTITKDFGNGLTVFCEKRINNTRYLVEIYGTATSVRRISMSVTTTPDKNVDAIALPEMRFLATVNYDRATPDAAAAWVGRHLGTNDSTTIAGVNFRLEAPTRTGRLLYLSN